MEREDGPKAPSARQERLAAQLRANLQRRKEQARARRRADQGDDEAGPDDDSEVRQT